MSFEKLEIFGLRGFAEKQTLNFGVPNESPGSGLTVLVGPNNSGKSTIFESLRVISQNHPPSFTEGKRNKKSGDKIEISIYRDDQSILTLKSIATGGSETIFDEKGLTKNDVNILTLPSRRTFEPYFNRGTQERGEYINSIQFQSTRGSFLAGFFFRLFNIQKSPEQVQKFNEVFAEVLEPAPSWYIDQADTGQYYVKLSYGDQFHNSDGAGEGLLSLMTIVDALYDSVGGDTIAIDEPELSLHPSLQRKLIALLVKYAATRQIIICTHSPYFVSWAALRHGGQLARTQKSNDGAIKVSRLSEKAFKGLDTLSNNLNNPHIVGLEAKEIFFLDDKILLVEGQEDVVFLKRICAIMKIDLDGSYYGWGAGGADNIPFILDVFVDMGFKKVVIILDNNKKEVAEKNKTTYPDYLFVVMPADDVRDKNETKARPAVEGIIDSKGEKINEKFATEVEKHFSLVKKYF